MGRNAFLTLLVIAFYVHTIHFFCLLVFAREDGSRVGEALIWSRSSNVLTFRSPPPLTNSDRSVNLKKKCELYPNCLDKLIKMQSFKTFLFRRASCRFSQTSHLIQILGHWKVHKMRGFLIDHHWGKWGKGWSRDSNSQGAGVGRIGVAVDICR